MKFLLTLALLATAGAIHLRGDDKKEGGDKGGYGNEQNRTL